MVTDSSWLVPVSCADDHGESSVFLVENLLREARRQRRLGEVVVPWLCLLDPDGDVVRHLRRQSRVTRFTDWACYHSEMWIIDEPGVRFGIVPCAVGAPYAVLVAEELCASGCRLVVSVTSAGVITPLGVPPYFVLIERALRGEGTSHRYLPAGEWSAIPTHLEGMLRRLSTAWMSRCMLGCRGRPTRRFGRRARRLDEHRRWECMQLRWKRPRSTRMPKRENVMSCVSPM